MKTKIILTLAILMQLAVVNAQPRSTMSTAEKSATIESTDNNPTTSTTLKATDDKTQKGFYISAGVNLANISGLDSTNSKAGLAISAGWEDKDDKAIGTWSVNYTSYGYQADYGGSTIKVSYPSIGWQTNFLFGLANNFYVGSGFGMHVILNGTMTYDGNSSDIERELPMDLCIPIIARYYVGKKTYIDARYNIGLGDMSGENTFGGNRNTGFQFSFGVML